MPTRLASEATIAVDETSAGTTVAVPVGATLCVRLRARPSAGYEWTLEDGPGTVLHADSPPGFVDTEPARRGAAVDQVFRLTAECAGSVSLSFAYRRSFEPAGAPDRRFQIEVRVLDTKE